MTDAALIAATRTRDIVIVFVGLLLAAACHLHGGGPRPLTRCAWTALNHSGVEECHVAGPLPDPPVTFMAVDTSSHLEL